MANNSNGSDFNGSSTIQPTYQQFSEEEEWVNKFYTFLAVTMIIIAILAIVFNSIVVYAFIAYRKLRTSATNYFVISLAISDLLTSGLVTTFKAETSLKYEKWAHGEFVCNVYTTMYLLAVPSTVINLCAFTVDRFLVLRMPLRYNSFMPPKRAALVISCLWIYAITWACLPVMGWKMSPGQPSVQGDFCFFSTVPTYNITVNIANFLLPMIFMAIFWSFIYSIVHQHRKRVLKIERSLSLNTNDSSNSSNNINANGEGHAMTHLAPKNERRERKRIRRNVRGCRYLGFIVVLFYFCWLPYVTASMIGNLWRWYKIPYVLYDSLLALGFMNSALNPFLYPFHDKHFKEAFRDMWNKLRSKTFVKLLSRKDGISRI